ncbi:S8 family serine peptidase [Dethiothermospora halolimnae]|uniref:S8 family serine peptidase n=1 Tax=Dethiothermospora halolimnae TaxID=3114390 RepID=UPI003CCC228F
MKIAIIDTVIQENKLINSSIKFKQEIICNKYFKEKQTLHGTNIANIILDTCSEINIEILSIAILDSNNKGSLADLLKALKVINENEIDVVNISLGVLLEGNFDKELSNYIDKELLKLKEKGVTIISAYHNSNKDSYPANSIHTLGVKNNVKEKNIFGIKKYYRKTDIIINRDESFVRNRDSIIIKKGNSYLCAKISGLYCLYKSRYNSIDSKLEFEDLLVNLNELLDSEIPDPASIIDSIVVSSLDKEDKLYKELKKFCHNLDIKNTTEIQDELSRGRLRENYLIGEIEMSDNIINQIIKKIMISNSELTFCYLIKPFHIRRFFSGIKKIHFMYL